MQTLLLFNHGVPCTQGSASRIDPTQWLTNALCLPLIPRLRAVRSCHLLLSIANLSFHNF